MNRPAIKFLHWDGQVRPVSLGQAKYILESRVNHLKNRTPILTYLKDIDTGVANSGHVEILKDTRVVSAARVNSLLRVQLTLSVYAHEIQRQGCACDDMLNIYVMFKVIGTE